MSDHDEGSRTPHREQPEILVTWGCSRAQGFLDAPARPASRIDAMLAGDGTTPP